jgi:hypothetical protein
MKTTSFQCEEFHDLYDELIFRMRTSGIHRQDLASFLLQGAFSFMKDNDFSDQETEDIIFDVSVGKSKRAFIGLV